MIALVATAGAAGGCAHHGPAADLAALEPAPEAVIQLRRGGCDAQPCPVYSVSIMMDGTYVYDGRANVATVGQRRGRLPPGRVNALIAQIQAMHFLDIGERCCACPEDDARSEPVILDYRPGFAEKTVHHDAGCGSAPAAVSALEEAIDNSISQRLVGEKRRLHGGAVELAGK